MMCWRRQTSSGTGKRRMPKHPPSTFASTASTGYAALETRCPDQEVLENSQCTSAPVSVKKPSLHHLRLQQSKWGISSRSNVS